MRRKWWTGLLALSFCFVGAVALTGCGDSTASSESKTLISAKEISHVSQTRVKQASQTVVNEDGSESVYGAELTNVYVKENLCFLEYRLGEIENCFIQPVSNAVRNDVGTEEIVVDRSLLTAETISNGISKSVSTTESTSVTTETSNTTNWSFSAGYSSSCSLEVGVGIKNVSSFSATVESAFEIGAEIGGGELSATVEEIASAVAKETNESYDVSKVQESLASMQVTYNMDEYEKGYWYALCMFADVEVYQIVAYDIDTEELYTTYFLGTMSETKGFRLVSSDNMNFSVEEEYQLKPITEIDVEQTKRDIYTIEYVVNGGVMPAEFYTTIYNSKYSEIIIPTPKYSSYEEYNHFMGWYVDEELTQPFAEDLNENPRNITLYAKWDLCTVYNNIYEGSSLDLTEPRVLLDWRGRIGTNTFRITTGRNVKEVIFLGDVGKIYNNITSIIPHFAVKGHHQKWEFVDFSFNISTSNHLYECEEFTLEIKSTGTCAIGTTAIGGAIFDMTGVNLEFTGSGKMSIYGGNGADATEAGCNGSNGGTAIVADELLVDMTGTLSVYGGNGGNGKNGDNGIDASSYDSSGTTGQNGGNGGNGGDAICVQVANIISKSNTYLFGGNGGSGGNGGNGGNGVTHEGKGPTNSHNDPGNGGSAGNGGCGGNGGNTGLSYDLGNGSHGGNGGSGGSKGAAGNAGCFWWAPWIGANQYWYGVAGATGVDGNNGTAGY